jgi:hypothetical protein
MFVGAYCWSQENVAQGLKPGFFVGRLPRTEVRVYLRGNGKRKRKAEQKQIPSLRYGMTNNRAMTSALNQ